METVEDLCDYIVMINKSQKVLEGSKREVKEKYRTNAYIVKHRGLFSITSNDYALIDQKKLDDALFQSTIHVTNTILPNQLIRELTDVTEVHSFVEKVPTMSEIFINLVKGESNE